MKTFDKLKEHLLCPVCTDVYKQPQNVRLCLHKFCTRCIEDYNRIYKKECPSCRVKCVSRRSLRRDFNFDRIVRKIYPRLEEYEVRAPCRIAEYRRRYTFSALLGSAHISFLY